MAPVADFTDSIPPCRSLCTAVRDSCSPAMARYDYPWPTMLNCTQFPPDDTLCIPSETKGPVETAKPAGSYCNVSANGDTHSDLGGLLGRLPFL